MPNLPNLLGHPASHPLARLRAYPLSVLTALFLIGMAVPFLLRHESEWEDVYVRAARHLRAGESIYNANEGFVYPPFLAMLAIPFSLLPSPAGRLLYYLANAAAMLLLCRWAWRLAGGEPLKGVRPVAWKERLAWMLGLCCGFRYVVDALAHQQPDLLIGALVLGGCVLLHSRPLLAATCFGIAAATKCTPLLWCGYLLWRKQWWPAAWLVGVAVGVNLLPDLVHGPAEGGLWVVEWFRRYLLPMTGADYLPGRWYSEIVYNQSLAGAINRWFATDWTWADASFAVLNRPDSPSPAALKRLLHGIEFALLGVIVLIFRRGAGNTPVATDRGRPPRAVLEYSVVLLLMLLLSPMSSKPHFCTVLLPAFCLARLMVYGRDRVLALLMLGAAAAGAAGIKGLWGGEMAALALWYGNVMWSALLLLAGCGYALARKPEISAVRSELSKAA